MNKSKLNCFVCNKTIRLEEIQPMDIAICYHSLLFHSSGNYGSKVFDPIDGNGGILQIGICDKCLLKNKERIRHIHNIATKRTADCRPFDPDFI